MTDSEKVQAVSALRKCAKEHKKDFTPTFNIRVSDLCSDVADYLEELQKENEELKEKMGSAGYRIAELKIQIENYILSENESKEIIAELKENHESDKRSLSLIVDKGLKLEEQIKEMKNDLFNVANKNTQAERLSAFWDMYHKYLD